MKRSETQGLERGLTVLECLVRQGTASVREVATHTRLPAATVRRLLNNAYDVMPEAPLIREAG